MAEGAAQGSRCHKTDSETLRQDGAPVIQRFLQLASSKGVLAIPSEALSLKELLRIHLKPVFKI